MPCSVHPFVDGNKRTAWILARLLLALNRLIISFKPEEAVQIVVALAAGNLEESESPARQLKPGTPRTIAVLSGGLPVSDPIFPCSAHRESIAKTADFWGLRRCKSSRPKAEIRKIPC